MVETKGNTAAKVTSTFAAVFVFKGLAFLGTVRGDAGNLYFCTVLIIIKL